MITKEKSTKGKGIYHNQKGNTTSNLHLITFLKSRMEVCFLDQMYCGEAPLGGVYV
jgi:hypothetical protein